ncbi:hypothetical protein GCM10018954_085250 [Kutzneria kofuensis]
MAINLDDARIPDNAGRSPVDEPIVDGGPAAYFTGLPVKAGVQAMQAMNVPRRCRTPPAVRSSAITLFYGLMHLIATERPHVARRLRARALQRRDGGPGPTGAVHAEPSPTGSPPSPAPVSRPPMTCASRAARCT